MNTQDDTVISKEEVRKAEEARQCFQAHLLPMFPTIVSVLLVHEGPNRAQRRAWKKQKIV